MSSPPETVSTNTETHLYCTISTIDLTSTHPTITTTIHSDHGTAPVMNLQPTNTSFLPKPTLPILSGDPLTWQMFWDTLNATVDSSHRLNSVQKFNYLKLH